MKRSENNTIRANVAQQRGPESVKSCYRCTKKGHRFSNCSLVGHNLWFCFICQALEHHNIDTCPKKQGHDGHAAKRKNSNNVDQFKDKTHVSRGGGRGGNSRGRSNLNNAYTRNNDITNQRDNKRSNLYRYRPISLIELHD